MDIFLSHNSKDKLVVEPIAIRLAEVFGRDHVFYDSWSIQPGDSIIGKMNEGLGNMDFFCFFISHNSINSKMVTLEWQAALFQASHNRCRFIPIRIDDCVMPPILLQNLYIDFCDQGHEIGMRQLMDVLCGRNTFRPAAFEFRNIVCRMRTISVCEVELSFVATRFMEPISRYSVLFKEDIANIRAEVLSDSMHFGGAHPDYVLSDASRWNGYDVGVFRPTTPGFPVRLSLLRKDGLPFGPILPMQYISETSSRAVTLFQENNSSASEVRN